MRAINRFRRIIAVKVTYATNTNVPHAPIIVLLSNIEKSKPPRDDENNVMKVLIVLLYSKFVSSLSPAPKSDEKKIPKPRIEKMKMTRKPMTSFIVAMRTRTSSPRDLSVHTYLMSDKDCGMAERLRATHPYPEVMRADMKVATHQH